MPTTLITGVNRGLGLELARQYLVRGWNVIGTSRAPAEHLDQLAAEHDHRLRLLHADMADIDGLSQLASDVKGTPIDVLLLSAGTMGTADFANQGMNVGGFGQIDYADWSSVMTINVLAPMRLAELLVDEVEASEQKKIVGMSSMLGSMGMNTIGGLYVYRTSKAALNSVLRSLSFDLAKRGISVAALHPGWVRTDMGGPSATLSSEESVRGLINVIADLSPERSGGFFSYEGETLPW
ncbi:MAG: SDR family oxidoreductase [Pseudomonadota bacterium]